MHALRHCFGSRMMNGGAGGKQPDLMHALVAEYVALGRDRPSLTCATTIVRIPRIVYSKMVLRWAGAYESGFSQ